MDRRGFLKTAVAGVAGAAGATLLIGNKDISFKPSEPVEPSDFKPDCEYGNAARIEIKKGLSLGQIADCWDRAKLVVYQDMLKVVPEQYRYRVQFRTKEPNYRPFAGIAWYYPPTRKLPLPLNLGRNAYHDNCSYGII